MLGGSCKGFGHHSLLAIAIDLSKFDKYVLESLSALGGVPGVSTVHRIAGWASVGRAVCDDSVVGDLEASWF